MPLVNLVVVCVKKCRTHSDAFSPSDYSICYGDDCNCINHYNATLPRDSKSVCSTCSITTMPCEGDNDCCYDTDVCDPEHKVCKKKAYEYCPDHGVDVVHG